MSRHGRLQGPTVTKWSSVLRPEQKAAGVHLPWQVCMGQAAKGHNCALTFCWSGLGCMAAPHQRGSWEMCSWRSRRSRDQVLVSTPCSAIRPGLATWGPTAASECWGISLGRLSGWANPLLKAWCHDRTRDPPKNEGWAPSLTCVQATGWGLAPFVAPITDEPSRPL